MARRLLHDVAHLIAGEGAGMPLHPGVRLGPYEILSPLGAGGMGEVYRARDTRLGREVAVKVLPTGFASDPERLRRFEQEARAVAALNHPNILSIYDFGREADTVYAVTELLEGEGLRERLAEGALPLRKAVDFAVQIAQGLAAAHERGVVHRDLKPDNLFVTKDGRVKILDFGLAGLLPIPNEKDTKAPTLAQRTEPGTLLGTVGYMSPELVRGQTADQRSDIFSFGAVLYEMLSGARAFQGDTAADTLSAILKEDPPEFRTTGKAMPPALDRIVRECLEKRPEDRFQSAHDLALALQALSGSEEGPSAATVQARAPGGWLTRHRATLGIAGAVVVVGALALAWSLFRARTKLLAPKPSARPLRSIAVLPLANLSGDPKQDYFSDGMTDALITELYKISGFEKVISRTSVMQFKGAREPLPQIAKELGVEAVLEGSVQRQGDRVRITVQLLDARSDKHLWAESYDREMRDVLNVESEIALAVAKQVQVALTPAESARAGKKRTVDPEVYDEYLKAYHLMYGVNNVASVREAVAALKGIVEKDPDLALAWARLGDGYLILIPGDYQPGAMDFTPAKEALERALTLDPDLALAHANLGFYKFYVEWDWEGAEIELRRALELDPNSVDVLANYIPYLCAMRRLDEALAMGKRLPVLDPANDWTTKGLAETYFRSGRYEEALVQYNAFLDKHPGRLGVLVSVTYCQLALGRREEALATLALVEKAFHKAGEPKLDLADLGEIYAMLGQRAKALAVVKRLEGPEFDRGLSCDAVAWIYVYLGDNDEAMRNLEVAYENRSHYLVNWSSYRDLLPKSFREDPRFKALLCKMKFPGACEGKP